ncbi:putative phosphoribosyl transferase [Marinobacter pelagius]|uniref:Putative phosphoribosyl transferase n=2 Tax=Marinobacter pelagius TaxID=379482 RepID=A0A1I4TAQ6_9GAMM|nr:putative phosphoribosyl transferase [Marinobacter pelagius]
MELPIKDRITAGRALAKAMANYRDRQDLLVLALPRGGVPVAYELAEALHAPLDLMLVRKLGSPGQQELAMGAIASGGVRVLNEELVSYLHVSEETLEKVAVREQKELERRERAYRGDRPWPEILGKCVILVDDGVATGATMRVAIKALRKQNPKEVVVAVPVAPPDTIEVLRREADDVVCLAMPEPFTAIGLWYVNFSQVSDEEVTEQLERAWKP